MSKICIDIGDKDPYPEDLGLSDGRRTSYGSVVKTMLDHADIAWIGDTDHKSDTVKDTILTDNIIAYAEGGASHIFLEASTEHQPRIDAMAENPASDTKTEDTARIQTMQSLGMEVHAVDPMTIGDKSGLSEKISGSLIERVLSQHEIYERLRRDGEIAENINMALPEGEKAVGIYGSQHGSRFNDLDENVDASMLRVDVYEDSAAINKRDDVYMGRNVTARQTTCDTSIRFGEDLPHLVYSVEDKAVYTTASTPEGLKSAIEKLGEPVEPNKDHKPSVNESIQENNLDNTSETGFKQSP